MLKSLRKSASGIVAKLLMGLLILSFAVWGIADVFRGFGSQTLATIGDTEITVPEFRELYQDRIQRMSQQLRRGITPDQARAFGIPEQILQERLAEAALDDQAKRLGLALSDAEIARRVQENPAFFGPSGQFDPGYFNQLLRSNNFTEARFVAAERGLALRQQLIQSLSGGIEIPKVLADALARYEGEERAINYAVATAASLPAQAEPMEEELRSFFDTRKVAFRAPEFRKIQILALTPQSLASAQEVTDAQVEAAYNDNIAQYGTPERRVVQQIVFPNEEEANAAAARIASGTSFADIASERKLGSGDTDLGDVAAIDIVDKAVAHAAFALAPNSTSGVVQGRFGPVIVHVGAVTPGTIRPLAEVAGEIRTRLQSEAGTRLLAERYDGIEDERAAGSSLAESAQKLGLQLQTIEADIQGRTPDNAAIADFPARTDVLRTAFASDVGIESDPIRLPQNGGFVWFEVESVTPPADRTFEQARPLVLERWKQDKAAQALDKMVEDVKAKVAAGTSFDQAVTEAGLELRAGNSLRRGRAAEGVPQEILEAVFSTPNGGVGSTLADGGDSRVLFRVINVNAPREGTANEELLSNVRQGLQNDLMTEYLVALQSQLDARINRTALDQIVGGGEAVN